MVLWAGRARAPRLTLAHPIPAARPRSDNHGAHTIQHMNGKTRRGVGNAFKTAVLLGALSALILLVGRLLGGTTGLVIAGIVAFAMNGFAYFYSDKLALRAMRAQLVSAQQAPWLHTMVAELVSRRGLPMPRV